VLGLTVEFEATMIHLLVRWIVARRAGCFRILFRRFPESAGTVNACLCCYALFLLGGRGFQPGGGVGLGIRCKAACIALSNEALPSK
jgi:hypothetical protein